MTSAGEKAAACKKGCTRRRQRHCFGGGFRRARFGDAVGLRPKESKPAPHKPEQMNRVHGDDENYERNG